MTHILSDLKTKINELNNIERMYEIALTDEDIEKITTDVIVSILTYLSNQNPSDINRASNGLKLLGYKILNPTNLYPNEIVEYLEEIQNTNIPIQLKAPVATMNDYGIYAI